jgi:hypothetical protein
MGTRHHRGGIERTAAIDIRNQGLMIRG